MKSKYISDSPESVVMAKTGGEADKIVATNILHQIGGYNRVHAMTGAYNFLSFPNGLSFRIKGRKVNYIKITLNGMDTYDIEFGKIVSNAYKKISEANDVYNDDLIRTLEKNTEMYFKFAKGGVIEDDRKDFLEELISIDSDVWDLLNISSGKEIRSSAQLQKEYALRLAAKLKSKGLKKGSLSESDFDYLTDENAHLLNEYLVHNGYFDKGFTEKESKVYESSRKEHPEYYLDPEIVSAGRSTSMSEDYVRHADIDYVKLKIDGKEVKFKESDILNGANKAFKRGGKAGDQLTNQAIYVPNRDVVEVGLDNGEKIHPLNGYWVKKSALKAPESKTDLSNVKISKITFEETNSYGNPDKLYIKSEGKRIADFYFNMRGYNANFTLTNNEGVQWGFSEKPKSTQVSEFKKALKDGFVYYKSFDKMATGGRLKRFDSYIYTIPSSNDRVNAFLVEDGDVDEKWTDITMEEVERIASEKQMHLKKFEHGGIVGKDVIFKGYSGELRKGHVTEELGKRGYEVSTDRGLVFVTPDEVVNVTEHKEPKEKRFFGFFKDGGVMGDAARNYLGDLWFAVHERRTEDYARIAEALDENNVPFTLQNAVASYATESRSRKAIDTVEVQDRILKLIEAKKFAKGGKTKAVLDDESDIDFSNSSSFDVEEFEAEYAVGGKLYSNEENIKEISRRTGVRGGAIEKFIEENDLNQEDVLCILTGLGRKQLLAMDFTMAVVGNQSAKAKRPVLDYVKNKSCFK